MVPGLYKIYPTILSKRQPSPSFDTEQQKYGAVTVLLVLGNGLDPGRQGCVAPAAFLEDGTLL